MNPIETNFEIQHNEPPGTPWKQHVMSRHAYDCTFPQGWLKQFYEIHNQSIPYDFDYSRNLSTATKKTRQRVWSPKVDKYTQIIRKSLSLPQADIKVFYIYLWGCVDKINDS